MNGRDGEGENWVELYWKRKAEAFGEEINVKVITFIFNLVCYSS